jgi:hypothetical protein
MIPESNHHYFMSDYNVPNFFAFNLKAFELRREKKKSIKIKINASALFFLLKFTAQWKLKIK